MRAATSAAAAHDRSALGVADVDDATLTAMVADLLGHPPSDVQLLSSRAEPVAYDIASITTVGRHWVSGRALTPDGERVFRMFVKLVQAWHHSPFFQLLPEEARGFARDSLPWRIEAAVYASDLASRLPEGLAMPRALGIYERDPDSVVLWLETHNNPAVTWDVARFERAAHLIGRLAGSPVVAELADVGEFPWSVMQYVHGRVLVDVVPQVIGEEAWASPQVAAAFGDLRDRMRAACSRVEEYGAELAAMPRATAHGDACPNNLLPGVAPDDFVLIDFGFWTPQPVAFDLGQLVGGDVQLGRLPDVPLADLDERCFDAYVAGLAAEGVVLPMDVVRRAHALHLLVFSGLSSLPSPDMPAEQVHARAALARLSLDLLDRTGG